MAGAVLRKAGVVLLTLLKWMLRALLAVLKIVFGMARLSLLLLALLVRIVLTAAGVMPGRRGRL